MVTTADVLVDAFERVRGVVHRVLDGLDPDQLASRPSDEANSIGWLIWHLTRIQDDHVADLAESGQVWTDERWAERFALPLPVEDTGFGHGPEEVAVVRVDANLLGSYLDAAHERTVNYLRTLDGDDLDRVVDERWDPPVTAGVRLVSVISDNLQHAGQAAYVRGLLAAEGEV